MSRDRICSEYLTSAVRAEENDEDLEKALPLRLCSTADRIENTQVPYDICTLLVACVYGRHSRYSDVQVLRCEVCDAIRILIHIFCHYVSVHCYFKFSLSLESF
jgi:hypothetical protein